MGPSATETTPNGDCTKSAQNDKTNGKSSTALDAEMMKCAVLPHTDFETAISAAGFGRFNIRLLLVSLLVVMASVCETSTMSYVFPSAECDLHLTLLDKGNLNAITYAGMITSAFLWGYLADTKGRKISLVLGLFLGGICDLGYSASQSVTHLMVLKFFGGFLMCGPYSILLSYLSEMHGKRYRARIMMISGFMIAFSNVILPLLALAILPSALSFSIGNLTFHTWQIFLAIAALPSLLSAFFLLFFPDSPKFYMSQGRNHKALEALEYMYSINKGKPKDSYPVKTLACEASEGKTNGNVETISAVVDEKESPDTPHPKHKMSLREGLAQLKPLFQKPYLRLSIQIYLINFCVLMGQNTLRLWLPQLFASINEYEEINGSVNSMCDVVEFCVNKTATVVMAKASLGACEVIITPATYMNNLVVGLTSLTGFFIASMVVNWIGTKNILLISLLGSGSCAIGLFLSTSAMTALVASALYATFGSIASTSVMSSSVNLFPTSLRAMIISLAMMFGRLASVVGNVTFPVLMSFGCVHPFILIGSVMFLAFILSLFLRSSSKTPLK